VRGEGVSAYLKGWRAGHEARDRGVNDTPASPDSEYSRGWRDGWTAADVRHARGRR
jgi:hypothetical protein